MKDVILPERQDTRADPAPNTAIWRIEGCIAADEGHEIVTIDVVVRLTVSPPAFIDAGRLDRAVAEAQRQGVGSPLPDPVRLAPAGAGFSRGSATTGCCRCANAAARGILRR